MIIVRDHAESGAACSLRQPAGQCEISQLSSCSPLTHPQCDQRPSHHRHGSEVVYNLNNRVAQVLRRAHCAVTSIQVSGPVATCDFVFSARQMWCTPGVIGESSVLPLSWRKTSMRLPST